MNLDLPSAWALITVLAVVAYVVMDGFDLGIGILFPLLTRDEREPAIHSIVPFWDGNETWLVLGGGSLFAAFPAAYAILFPATYPLLIVMLLGLVFRGVAFEFRFRNAAHRRWWDRAFAGGSLVAALAQGMTLGAILQGVRVSGRVYGGGPGDWLSWFSLLTGASLVVGYAWLGACWLVWRTDGPTQRHARALARPLAWCTLGVITMVSAATPFLSSTYWQRWFVAPGLALTAPVPVILALVAWRHLRALAHGAERTPFLTALAVFLLCFAGLGVSLWPYVVPEVLTFHEAAAPASSLAFLLAGTLVIVPVIIGYTTWAYWVFRGKSHAGYH